MFYISGIVLSTAAVYLRTMWGLSVGIGVGLSATYGCQAVFNTFGALSIAVGILGLPGAVFFRIFNNFSGLFMGFFFERGFGRVLDRVSCNGSIKTSKTDTDNFLSSLRRLFPPPPANSHAKTACSDTLTEAGYARCGNENQPTVLSWILLPNLPHLLDGTVCHACTQADNIIFVMSHAQIYIEQRMTRKLKSSINYFRF